MTFFGGLAMRDEESDSSMKTLFNAGCGAFPCRESAARRIYSVFAGSRMGGLMQAAVLLPLILFWAAEEPLHEAELVFPPEKMHNHASTIVETPKGDLLVAWFHGKGERRDDTLVISGARRKKGTANWSAPFLLADNKNLPDQNPVLFIDPSKKLWLFWISSMDNEVRGYFLKYRTSLDYEGSGAPRWNWQDAIFCRPQDLESTFTGALDKMLASLRDAAVPEMTPERKASVDGKRKMAGEKLFQRLGWMPRQPPIMLTDSRMMLGLYSDVFDCSLSAFTQDGGETWEFSKPMILSSFGNIQPALVRKKDGNIVAFMRSGGFIRRIRRAESADGGMTWTEVPMEIPNPGSSVAAVGLKSGNWLLVCNDTERGRHVQTAYLSDDEGNTWKWKRRLESFADPQGNTASYPTVIQAADGSLHCTYTFQDKAHFEGEVIKHVRFNEAWIKAAEKW
jgi:predicted neuraminidase